MRILHLARRFFPAVGGVERYVLDLASAQAAAGHTVTVVTIDHDILDRSIGTLPSEEVVAGVHVQRLPGFGGRRFAMSIRPDRIATAVASADVAHVHDLRFMFGTSAVAARARHKPLILHTHGLIFHTPFLAGLKRVALRAYFEPIARFAHVRVVASSASDADRVRSVLPSLGGRTVNFDNALRLDRLHTLRRNPQPGTLLTVGRVARHKGIDRLIRALHRVERFWQLELIGPTDRAELVRLSHLSASLAIGDRVVFRGQTDDAELLAALSRAELGLFPSRAEGFGLALLESIAVGVPVIASDIPAHRDLLGPALEELLVDFDDSRAVATRIDNMLDLDAGVADVLSDRLRERSRAFSMDRLVSQLEELYDSMIR